MAPALIAQDPEDLMRLLGSATDFALTNGLIVKSESGGAKCAPFTLHPSCIPRLAYDRTRELQPLLQKLTDLASRDPHFLLDALEDVAKVDDFTSRLLQIHRHVLEHGTTQPKTLAIPRSDYMIQDDAKPVQLEYNTIAASGSSLSALTTALHTYLINIMTKPCKPKLPVNESLDVVAEGLGQAWRLYGVADAVVLMVVQPDEENVFDQRWIEYTLMRKFDNLRLLRRSLSEIHERASLSTGSRLIIDNQEIAVTYFRAGYAPSDYPTESEWKARLLIEESLSLKCPNIAHHLMGTKKVQQVLAMPQVIERYLNLEEANLVRSCFVGLYPLDESEEGLDAIQKALKHPDRFVMKPSREGGGNNLFGPAIKAALETLSLEERGAYILMDLVKPISQRNVMVRDGVAKLSTVVSEFGVFGIWLSEEETTHINVARGHLLRTKSIESQEGGVFAGYAVFDSPCIG
ncbi:glutathione synthase [Synchytrium microbalum]|uniref:Glutathione synthetase n=1 Tax=Synchytrium microbalum TaxID=1806994 RepID=A0A507BNM3_9FUNG|nr:glutathione synthase [Synchytrium microbalum]TPX31680.1 glutathione synthase [Synchytrium microbalum]